MSLKLITHKNRNHYPLSKVNAQVSQIGRKRASWNLPSPICEDIRTVHVQTDARTQKKVNETQ